MRLSFNIIIAKRFFLTDRRSKGRVVPHHFQRYDWFWSVRLVCCRGFLHILHRPGHCLTNRPAHRSCTEANRSIVEYCQGKCFEHSIGVPLVSLPTSYQQLFVRKARP